MELNYTNLEQVIKKLGHTVAFQKESGQLVMTFKANLIEYPVFLRILQKDTLLQLVMFLPCKSDEKTLPEALNLLNFFNRELDLPGFCYDDMSKLIFYRLVIPAFDHLMISVLTLEKIFEVLPTIATTFAPLTQLVCNGSKTYNDIKNDFNKASKR